MVNKLSFIVVIVILSIVYNTVSSKKVTVSFCPSLKCATKYTTELERWDCIGRQLLGPLPSDKIAKKQYFVEHDCGGVGWGNSIRGLYNSASIAAISGRRLIVTHAPFNRMFLPPYMKDESTSTSTHPHQSDWSYGLYKDPSYSSYHNKQVWNYEAYGRDKENYVRWGKLIKEKPQDVEGMEKTVMQAGVCGGDRNIMLNGDCLSSSMKLFAGCALNTSLKSSAVKYSQSNALKVAALFPCLSNLNAAILTLSNAFCLSSSV